MNNHNAIKNNYFILASSLYFNYFTDRIKFLLFEETKPWRNEFDYI